MLCCDWQGTVSKGGLDEIRKMRVAPVAVYT